METKRAAGLQSLPTSAKTRAVQNIHNVPIMLRPQDRTSVSGAAASMELLFVHFYCGAYDSQSTTKIAMDVLHPTSPNFTATEIPF